MLAVSAAHRKKGPFLAVFAPANLQTEMQLRGAGVTPPTHTHTSTDLKLKNTLTINVGKKDEGERKNLWEMFGKGLDLGGKCPPKEDIYRGETTGNIKSSGK